MSLGVPRRRRSDAGPGSGSWRTGFCAGRPTRGSVQANTCGSCTSRSCKVAPVRAWEVCSERAGDIPLALPAGSRKPAAGRIRNLAELALQHRDACPGMDARRADVGVRP